MRETLAQMQILCDMIDSIKEVKIDYTRPVDTEVVNKYRSRFNLFCTDGVRDAIYAYMDDLHNHDYSDLTILEITNMALEFLKGNNEKN